MVVVHKDHKEMNVHEVSQSEKKRLESLKQKKQAFRAKELAVQNALKNLDSKLNNSKIVFDDDFGDIEESKQNIGNIEKKRKRDLFDDGDNSDEKNDDSPVWDDSKFEIKKSTTGKLFPPTLTFGNDERFKLDERFMEDDPNLNESISPEINDETNLQKEKELQLDILENILGVPIDSKNKAIHKDSKHKKIGMIRYDPTENDHKEYEITIEKPESDTKKVKKKKKSKDNTEEAIVNAPIEVSKDVYFSVSDTLAKSLKEGGQFSLLKTYAKVETDRKDDSNAASNAEPLQPQKFSFNFTAKNPFKYDSSDDERDEREVDINTEQRDNNVVEDTNKLFFDSNDVRFNEAQKFFSKTSIPEETFKVLRRELKQIVRSKIRKNIRKKEPWGYKKKIKKSS